MHGHLFTKEMHLIVSNLSKWSLIKKVPLMKNHICLQTN